MNTQVKQLVTDYNGSNSFMNSLRYQLLRKGSLSERQVTAAEQFFNICVNAPQPQPTTFTRKSGDEITIRKWYAQVKGKDLGIGIFFRNLILEEVLNETPKAIQVKVRFNSKITNCCHICGLGLDNEISKACGIGPVCAKRLGFKRVTLKDAGAILAKIQEEAQIAGVIGPLWIPKSQIVSLAEQILFEKDE